MFHSILIIVVVVGVLPSLPRLQLLLLLFLLSSFVVLSRLPSARFAALTDESLGNGAG